MVLRSDIGKDIPAKMQSVHKSLLANCSAGRQLSHSEDNPVLVLFSILCIRIVLVHRKKERGANREWRGKGEKYEKEIIYMNPRNIEVSYTKSANTIKYVMIDIGI